TFVSLARTYVRAQREPSALPPRSGVPTVAMRAPGKALATRRRRSLRRAARRLLPFASAPAPRGVGVAVYLPFVMTGVMFVVDGTSALASRLSRAARTVSSRQPLVAISAASVGRSAPRCVTRERHF